MDNIYEIIVTRSAEIENLLKKNGAIGSGLKELRESISGRLPNNIISNITRVARLRNKVFHQNYKCSDSELKQFIKEADVVIAFMENQFIKDQDFNKTAFSIKKDTAESYYKNESFIELYILRVIFDKLSYSYDYFSQKSNYLFNASKPEITPQLNQPVIKLSTERKMTELNEWFSNQKERLDSISINPRGIQVAELNSSSKEYDEIIRLKSFRNEAENMIWLELCKPNIISTVDELDWFFDNYTLDSDADIKLQVVRSLCEVLHKEVGSLKSRLDDTWQLSNLPKHNNSNAITEINSILEEGLKYAYEAELYPYGPRNTYPINANAIDNLKRAQRDIKGLELAKTFTVGTVLGGIYLWLQHRK